MYRAQSSGHTTCHGFGKGLACLLVCIFETTSRISPLSPCLTPCNILVINWIYFLTILPLAVCRLANVFCLLPSQLSSSFLPYPLSPDLAMSYLSFGHFTSTPVLPSVISFSWFNLYPASVQMSKPSQPLLSEELRHRVHVCLFP